MATNNKTPSGIPKPLPTDEIDVVDIQGIADKVEETIQNLNLVKVEKTSYGTGSSPVVHVQLPIPDGCTHEGVIYHYTSSVVLINYHAAKSTPYFIINFYSFNGTNVPADRFVKVTAWFRKS